MSKVDKQRRLDPITVSIRIDRFQLCLYDATSHSVENAHRAGDEHAPVGVHRSHDHLHAVKPNLDNYVT